MDTLDKSSEPESVYPYSMLKFANASRHNRFNPKPEVENLFWFIYASASVKHFVMLNVNKILIKRIIDIDINFIYHVF